MKTSEEMTISLLERRTEYYKNKAEKRNNAVKFISTFAVCMTIITSAIAVIPSLINNKTLIMSEENKITTVQTKHDTTVYKKTETTASKTHSTENTTIKTENTTIKNENTTIKIEKETTLVEKTNTTKYHETTQQSYDKGEIELTPFGSSPKDRDSDYFGEDELEHTDIILNGNRLYEQFPESEYKYYGIENTLKKSDFGDFIGTIKEIGSYSEAVSSSPCSQEPTLSGCEVYFFKPVNCEAIIIAYGNEHCSLFRFSSFTDSGFSFADKYRIFNISSADDIKAINYTIKVSDGAVIINKAEGNISSASEINSFFSITTKMKPYTHNALSGSPEWLNEARTEYKQLSNDKQITIDAAIILRNGLTIDFSYQPNLGTGYIDGHHFLSEADNAVIKQLFGIL